MTIENLWSKEKTSQGTSLTYTKVKGLKEQGSLNIKCILDIVLWLIGLHAKFKIQNSYEIKWK
jgi:hypothetical protein